MAGPSGAFSVRETHGILWRPANRVRVASEGLGWSSLYASAQLEKPYEDSFRAVPDHLVIVHLDGPVGVSRVLGKSLERRTIAPGGLFILPGGVDFGVELEGQLESLHVYLRDAVLRQVAAELVPGDPALVELVPRLGDQDALIEHLALGIREALTDPDPGARVYTDQLARVLGARLLRAHSNRVPRQVAPPPGGLTRNQLARAIEFMDANLSGSPFLEEIADAAGLIPAVLNLDRCPYARGDGTDARWIGHQRVPGVFAGVLDCLVAVPDAQAELVAAQILPDVLDRVQFGCVGRQRQQGDVVGDGQTLAGLVPSGAVAHEHGMSARRDLAADLAQMLGHRLAVDPRHDDRSAGCTIWTDRAEQVGVVVAVVAHRRRTRAALTPDIG